MSNVTLKDLPGLAKSLKLNPATVESFLLACKLKNLTTKSLQGYGERIFYLMRWGAQQGRALDQLTKPDLQRYLMDMVEHSSVVTVNGSIAVFKVFYKHMKAEGFIDADPVSVQPKSDTDGLFAKT